MKRLVAILLAQAIGLIFSDISLAQGLAQEPETTGFVEQARQTKTPYRPQQDIATLQAVPAGYKPVFTELLARHGSRGLTGVKVDLALWNLLQQAQKEDALTPLGQQLSHDLMALIKANALLGYAVSGISSPGYGNETEIGFEEHTGLAQRLQKRLPALFGSIEVNTQVPSRHIVVVTSGKDRAMDSGAAFVRALVSAQPNLQAAMEYPAAPVAMPGLAGTDAFLLYFHKLPNKLAVSEPLAETVRDSQAYRAYLASPDLQQKLAQLQNTPMLKQAAHAVLESIVKAAFVARLERGEYSFSNTGSLIFTSEDGKFVNKITGDGAEKIHNEIEAARALYEIYAIAGGMQKEIHQDFSSYLPLQYALVFAEIADAEDFYLKGPSTEESHNVTHRMARILLRDFFNEADAIVKGDMKNAAKLRFSHAEIIIPFAAELGLPNASQPLALSRLYSYANNPWRGADISPMAANIQWDIFQNSAGHTLVRMLYNEKEIEFKPQCASAKIAASSYFYDYSKLRSCYQPL
jgi:Histidine phosphatase superfamily (branch 2)